MRNTLTMFLAATGLFLGGPTLFAVATDTTVSIQRAVAEGKVEVQVSSLGGATGDTVRVDVRRKVPQKLHLEINPGTVFIAPSGNVQNMAGGVVKGEFIGPNTYRPTNVNVMVLADDAWHGYLVQSFCMDFHKPPPQRGHRFTLAIEDQRVARILQVGKDEKTPLWAFQFALWMDREGIAEKELLGRYGHVATEVDLRIARELIKKAEAAGVEKLPPDMPADVRVEVKRLFSPDPAERAAAVKVLVGMGARAKSAAPFLAENVTTATPGQLTPATWVNILTDPQQTNVTVETAGLPELKALVDALRERRAERAAEHKDDSPDKPGAERTGPLRKRLRPR